MATVDAVTSVDEKWRFRFVRLLVIISGVDMFAAWQDRLLMPYEGILLPIIGPFHIGTVERATRPLAASR